MVCDAEKGRRGDAASSALLYRSFDDRINSASVFNILKFVSSLFLRITGANRSNFSRIASLRNSRLSKSDLSKKL